MDDVYKKLTLLSDRIEWGGISEAEILKIIDEIRESIRNKNEKTT